MWDYITEFWDSLTAIGDYSIEWFENIGNAVAGAVGGLFDWIIHYMNDFFIFIGWVFSAITKLIQTFTLPISYTFNFLKEFTSSAFSEIQAPDISYSFSSGTMAVFQAIPYWNVILAVLGISVSIIVGFAVFRLFLKL